MQPANSYTLVEVCPDGITDFATNVHSGSVAELCDGRCKQSIHIAVQVIQFSQNSTTVCPERQSA